MILGGSVNTAILCRKIMIISIEGIGQRKTSRGWSKDLVAIDREKKNSSSFLTSSNGHHGRQDRRSKYRTSQSTTQENDKKDIFLI